MIIDEKGPMFLGGSRASDTLKITFALSKRSAAVAYTLQYVILCIPPTHNL